MLYPIRSVWKKVLNCPAGPLHHQKYVIHFRKITLSSALDKKNVVLNSMAVTLSELPLEILHQIISYISPSSLPTVQAVSRKYNDLPRPILWRDHCRTHFKYWSPQHDSQQRLSAAVAETDWKELFSDRYSIDRSITRDVDGILGGQQDRIEKAERIMRHGYDAKDALLQHLNVGDDAEDVLARRYCSIDSEYARIDADITPDFIAMLSLGVYIEAWRSVSGRNLRMAV